MEEADLQHILDVMAWNVQFPDRKVRHALVLGGYPGIGKDVALMPFLMCIGAHNVSSITGKDLLQDFNGYLRAKKVLNVQEVNLADHRDAQHIEEKLKQPIGDEVVSITPKGKETFNVPNFLQVLMTTNWDHPFKLSRGDRRYHMTWLPKVLDEAARAANATYFDQLVRWYQGGGAAAIYFYLLTRDVSGFDPEAPPPSTSWHGRVMASSQTRLEEALSNCIENRFMAFGQLLASPEALTHSINVHMGLAPAGGGALPAVVAAAQAHGGRPWTKAVVARALAAVGAHHGQVRDTRVDWRLDRKRRYLVVRQADRPAVEAMNPQERNDYLDFHENGS